VSKPLDVRIILGAHINNVHQLLGGGLVALLDLLMDDSLRDPDWLMREDRGKPSQLVAPRGVVPQ